MEESEVISVRVSEEDDEQEMTDLATAPVDVEEIIALEDLNLNKADEDDTDLLLQMIYPEYRLVFPLAQLSMELLFKIGRYFEKLEQVTLLLTDRWVSCHRVVRLRLLQLRREKMILW